MIIILEGADAVGKSTVTKALEEHFISLNKAVRILQEPGSNVVGQVVRPIVKNGAISELTALLLFSASNSETLRTLAKAEDDDKYVYIVDRSVFSTIVYQHSIEPSFYRIKDAITDEFVRRTLNLDAHIFVLSVPPEVAHTRIVERAETDRYEVTDMDVITRRHNAYKQIADRHNLAVIDSSNSVEATLAVILAHIKRTQRYAKFKEELKTSNELQSRLVLAVHEANKEIQQQTGEFIPELNEHLTKSILDGVYYVLDNPNCTPEQQHNNWCYFKRQDGWKYGPNKDFERKEHPCLVPYNELPEIQQRKDSVFRQTLDNFISEVFDE
jgi:dTMP kinase